MSCSFRKLLVANRGEIATRILSTARELDLETYALYTENDSTHAYNVDYAIRLSSPAAYMDIDELVQICKKHAIEAVHPGYGFLSESAELTRRMQQEGIIVIGPGSEILDRTGDKLQARRLAEECEVPVLPALATPTSDIEIVRHFADGSGYPIMIKAVDGGGGRGIRLVTSDADLDTGMTRAIEESPSRRVFAEKAAISGFRHIEIQIIGDGQGHVTHLWERECSIQRRYQKIAELAPSSVSERRLVSEVINAALRMARKVRYRSLGTFEFLVNPSTSEIYFLEINPRLQVEHTITESICSTDIVRAQLLIAQGKTLLEAGIGHVSANPERPPPLHSLQLRITAEDPEKNWSLSVGKIQSFHFPSGNGIRVDTNLLSGAPAVISADFDSLIAKLIITAPTWEAVLQKAKRALQDTRIVGIRTNLTVLKAIVTHPHFAAGSCDTRWLESKQSELLSLPADQGQRPGFGQDLFKSESAVSSTTSISSASTLFRKDDAWSISLSPQKSSQSQQQQEQKAPYHLQLQRVLRNDFPTSLSADILFTAPQTEPVPYTMRLESTSASASALGSGHRQGSPSDPSHVIIPFSGKLIEVLVDVGDKVGSGTVICVVRQMKMELEVRASRAGVVGWVTEAEDGEDVAEGMLAAVVKEESSGRRELKL